MAKRHKGIVTFGVLGIVFGTIGLFINGFIVLVLMLNAIGSETAQTMGEVSLIALISLSVNFITSIMVLISGIGIFLLLPWARTGFLAAASITIANRILVFPLHFTQGSQASESVQAAANQAGSIFGDLCVIVFNILIVWFFKKAEIKALFNKKVIS